MKGEMQLAYPQNLPVVADDLWGHKSAPEVHGPSPLKKMHRLLRGRYVLTATLAVVCALGGAYLGYRSQQPRYQAWGLIEIKPTIPVSVGTTQEQMITAYSQFMRTQAALLQDPRTIRKAMGSDEWQKLGRGLSPAEVAGFMDNLEVAFDRDSALLRVTFWDLQPEVTAVATEQVIRAYLGLFEGEYASKDYEVRRDYLEKKQRQLTDQIRGNRDQIMNLAKGLGGTDTPEALLDEQLKRWNDLRARYLEAHRELDTINGVLRRRAELAADAATQPTSQPTWTALAETDPEMQRLVRERRATNFELEKALIQGKGDNHPTVKTLRSTVELYDREIKAQSEELAKANNVRVTPAGARVGYGQEDLLIAEERVRVLEKAMTSEKAETEKMAVARMQIANLRTAIQTDETDLAEAKATLERLSVQDQLTKKMRVISYGEPPVRPAQDRRRQYAVLGMMGGGAFPIMLFLLIGLLDQRYRYSDDAGEGKGIALLGILPNLPDLLTDPDQAAVAAHCVHQIRTMLQINAPEDRRAFAITSASPGDGKTSLTLALGLSFAASGSRTLLIDCDLAGGGLTARLNMITPDGVLEAVSHRSLLEFVRTTDITDLAILPVGDAHAHHASALSPAALRRLVAEARKHFDTVLIDSGPLLGSIEASAVCAAVDGTILVVARGQQRPLVEKAISHLKAIGARLAGVVFNRAQARDFDRSVNRLSMARSIQRNGAGLPRPKGAADAGQFGPVARAVATTVPPSANGNGDTPGGN